MNNRTRLLLTGAGTAVLAVVVAGISFALIRSLGDGGAAQAQRPPDPIAPAGATPIPGATPDKREPGWYVPYLTADSQKPPFMGELAGISLRPFDSSVPIEDAGGCPPGTSTLGVRSDEDLKEAPLGIRLGSQSSVTAAVGPPEALECDGRLVTVQQYFDVLSADSTRDVRGSLKIFRSSVGHRFWLPAPEDRWSVGAVAGRPAAILQPVIETIGTSAVIMNDGSGYTAIIGEGVTVAFLALVAEEVQR